MEFGYIFTGAMIFLSGACGKWIQTGLNQPPLPKSVAEQTIFIELLSIRILITKIKLVICIPRILVHFACFLIFDPQAGSFQIAPKP